MSSYSYNNNNTTTATSNYVPPSRPGGDAKALQERLHELISRLSDTTDVVKTWPEASGDDASIHIKTTSKLIHTIQEILKAIDRVEGVAKNDVILWNKLQNCPIPLDLLEMMDVSSLNPEMFMRGLLKEALSQLAGLRRRKVALSMLGEAIQKGLDQADDKNNNNNNNNKEKNTKGTKREREEGEELEPPAKKSHGAL